jgi:hypothetical protein
VLAALLALAGGCGSDEPTPLATDNTERAASSSTTGEGTMPDDDAAVADPSDDAGSPAPVVEDDAGYEPTAPMLDITDPRPHSIDDVVVSDDDTTLGVRYEAASEPCSGAVAEVTETADTVTVVLETGLNPDAAALSCIAQVIAYELAVPLDAPLGDRALVFDREPGDGDDGSAMLRPGSGSAPDPGRGDTGSGDAPTSTTTPSTTSPPNDDSPPDGLAPASAYVGLTIGEATRKADGEGRPWRIGRRDDELFALTADYNPDRLTFEVDADIVTRSVTG